MINFHTQENCPLAAYKGKKRAKLTRYQSIYTEINGEKVKEMITKWYWETNNDMMVKMDTDLQKYWRKY